jgi:KDO2-lipid IV(A) lauroyltransferase
MSKKINYFLQAVIIYFFFLIGRILGIFLSRKIFSFLFSKIGPLIKSKEVVNYNLKLFNKDLSISERENIKKNMWRNYGMTFIEYVFLDKFKKRNSHITIKGEENLSPIIKGNRQAIFISGHFANFELMSMEISKKNINLATIYRPLNNFFLNPFMEFLRKKYVCKNQIKKGINGVRQTIDFINNQHSVALMIDQRVSEGELINFFEKPALTTTLPAHLSKKYNLPIIPVIIQRINDDKFVIEFKEKIEAKDYRNKLDLTKKLNNILEDLIIHNPNQWIWTHNRWK